MAADIGHGLAGQLHNLGGHSGQGDGCPGVDLDDRHHTGLVLQFLGQPAQA